MTIRERINNLEAEKEKYQLENQRLNKELKEVISEKKKIERELNSLKSLLNVNTVSEEPTVDNTVEEPAPKKSRKKKVEPVEEPITEIEENV